MTGPIHFLLIDDEEVEHFLNKRMLLKLSVPAECINTFERAQDALNFLDAGGATPSAANGIILLDLNMPEMDGWGFLEAFERLAEDLKHKYKVVIVSSSINPRDEERSRTYPSVHGFISKPLTVDKFQVLLSEG